MRAITFSLILLGLLVGCFPANALAAPPVEEPDPTPMVIDPRMDRPVLSENPSRAELGSIVYFEYCLACHADQGQGLTDEYRRMAYGEDMNCWQSKCHATNHPTPGFIFPRVVPPVIGEGTLKRFVNAEDLYQYLLLRMPYYKYDMPPEIPDDDMWNVTAYLLKINGVLPDHIDFDPQQASIFPVHLTARSHGEEQVVQIVLLGSLALVVVGLLVQRGWRSASSPATRPSFIHHLHPPSIPQLQARWRYTLSAGGLAVFCLLVVVFTGILEMFFYVPTPESAGNSIQMITYAVPYGALVRGLHFWSAQALVVVSAIHLLRVIFTGAYTAPRRLNYLLGLGLLLLSLLLDFTGYVLRWDEGIRWALTVGTNLLKSIPVIGQALYGFIVGADLPGATTLTRFYAWHVLGLTAILLGIFTWHIFRVRRDGGISAPPPEARSDSQRITRFELLRREILAALLALIILIVVAARLPAPIDMPIQEFASLGQANPEAPWFFLWVQQLLRYGDAFLLGIAVPLGILALLALLPYLVPHIPAEQQGHWFPRAGRIAQFIAALLAIGWLVLTLLELF
jgi:quinol-cytochrome oxidoreductase complex cytochrome b subunit